MDTDMLWFGLQKKRHRFFHIKKTLPTNGPECPLAPIRAQSRSPGAEGRKLYCNKLGAAQSQSLQIERLHPSCGGMPFYIHVYATSTCYHRSASIGYYIGITDMAGFLKRPLIALSGYILNRRASDGY